MTVLNIANQAASPARGRRKNIHQIRELGLGGIIVAICIVMSVASPYFLTWSNIRAIMMSFAIDGIVAIGMTLLLIVGGIDLSVGSVVCLSMVVAGKLFLLGMTPWVAGLLGIATGSLVGVLLAVCVTVIGLDWFIASMAFMVIARGVALLITQGTPLSLFALPANFKFIGQGTVVGLPVVILIFVALVIVFDILLRRATVFRKVFYTGSNEKAAEFSGININRVKFGVAILSSTLAGLAGVIYMARYGAATPSFGIGMELNVIAAAVIGGASLKGGTGSIMGAVLGMGLLSLVTNSLILIDVSVYWQDATRGMILLLAVTLDHLIQRSKNV
jgi:ribose transport system permease protein